MCLVRGAGAGPAPPPASPPPSPCPLRAVRSSPSMPDMPVGRALRRADFPPVMLGPLPATRGVPGRASPRAAAAAAPTSPAMVLLAVVTGASSMLAWLRRLGCQGMVVPLMRPPMPLLNLGLLPAAGGPWVPGLLLLAARSPWDSSPSATGPSCRTPPAGPGTIPPPPGPWLPKDLDSTYITQHMPCRQTSELSCKLPKMVLLLVLTQQLGSQLLPTGICVFRFFCSILGTLEPNQHNPNPRMSHLSTTSAIAF